MFSMTTPVFLNFKRSELLGGSDWGHLPGPVFGICLVWRLAGCQAWVQRSAFRD